MYIAVVVLTMLVLPAGAVVVEHHLAPAPLMLLVGRWFVFWAVGVRLALAGARQLLRPAFTAREIFHIDGDAALPLVREIGMANLAIAVVALLSIVRPAFVLPAAIYATLFFGFAGLGHLREPSRSLNETVAMVSDLGLAALLVAFVAWSFPLKG